MRTRASETSNMPEKTKLLSTLVESAYKYKDNHNAMRALIRHSKILVSQGERPNKLDMIRLFDAYHHLYNQRQSKIFDDCHQTLWELFTSTNDQYNLFRLFRHSSFIWRLRGAAELEQLYLKKLLSVIELQDLSKLDKLDLVIAYFLTRANYKIKNL